MFQHQAINMKHISQMTLINCFNSSIKRMESSINWKKISLKSIILKRWKKRWMPIQFYKSIKMPLLKLLRKLIGLLLLNITPKIILPKNLQSSLQRLTRLIQPSLNPKRIKYMKIMDSIVFSKISKRKLNASKAKRWR